MSALPPIADIRIEHDCFVPGADILAAVSHCSVPAETCESNVRFGINSLVTSAVGRTSDLGSSKNLDFQDP
jgi:hypothetical protein